MANKGKRLLAVLLATAFLLCLFLSGYAEDPGVENPEDDVTKTGETGQDEVTAAAHRNRLRNRKGQKDGADNRNAGNHEPGMPGGPLNGGLKTRSEFTIVDPYRNSPVRRKEKSFIHTAGTAMDEQEETGYKPMEGLIRKDESGIMR